VPAQLARQRRVVTALGVEREAALGLEREAGEIGAARQLFDGLRAAVAFPAASPMAHGRIFGPDREFFVK
jgi:hypothetical protein